MDRERKIASIEEELKGLKAKVAAGERDVRRTLKPLREVWLEVGIEKLDNHEGVTVKVLLDSGATGIFVDKKFCHNSELNPKLSPAFIGLLNNLRDYNTPNSIYNPGQVTVLRK